MNFRTPQQNKQLHTLFALLKIDEDTKIDLVSTFSAGRTETSKELYVSEAAELIKWLNEQQTVRDTPENKMRRSILACCHTMRWYERAGGALVILDGKPQLDMERVNTYCETHTAAHKPLNEQSATELQATVYQFQQMAKNYLSGAIKTEREPKAETDKKFGKAEYRQTLIDLGVSVQVADDFIELRVKKRATFTKTALTALVKECDEHNYPLEEALKTCIARNWQGFKYEWLNGKYNSYGKDNGTRDWRN